MHSLILDHPMVDGNKRLGIASTVIFLERNGLVLAADNTELEAFTLRVAQGGVAVDEIAGWFRSHTIR
jgi:death-on-curing protein